MGDASAQRWQVEHVHALAPSPSSLIAAQPVAVPSRWTGLGCDARGLWGRCAGGASEPYDCVVDHVGVAFRCSCPSRRHPCKHALALLLLWVRGLVPEGAPAGAASTWLLGRAAADAAAPPAAANLPPSTTVAGSDAPPAAGSTGAAGDVAAADGAEAPPSPPPDPTAGRDDRVARMVAGLAELDRWLADRLRTGLADPALGRYATWDALAARLVDAQAGSLANRVRRLAGRVGSGPTWHEQVLAELGLLHLLAQAGRHLGTLPLPLGEAVAAAVGWQVRQADVLAGVPHTDTWVVMGRSDVREDRIEVRRVWLRGATSGQWAMLLSFAAYQQRLDDTWAVGTAAQADLFRYPGVSGLRALVGRRAEHATPHGAVGAVTVAGAAAEAGAVLAAEPWLDRVPVCLVATVARSAGRFVLADGTGSLPLAPADSAVAPLLACTAGAAVPITAEWTPTGLVPLTVHLADRSVDIGPQADPSFVGAA